MCKFKSFIVTIDGIVHYSVKTDSHDVLLEELKLTDDTADPELIKFARVEIVPPARNVFETDLSKWKLNIDQSIKPKWWGKDLEEKCFKKLKEALRKQVLIDQTNLILKDGLYFVSGGTVLDVRDGGTVQDVRDGGTVQEVNNGGTVQDVRDGGTVQDVNNGGTVQDVWDGGTVQEVNNGGTVQDVRNGGTVQDVWDGGTVQNVNKGGTVQNVNNGGTVLDVRDGGTVQEVNSGGTVHYVNSGGTVLRLEGTGRYVKNGKLYVSDKKLIVVHKNVKK